MIIKNYRFAVAILADSSQLLSASHRTRTNGNV